MRDGAGLDLAASSVTPPGTAPLLAIEGLTVAFDGVPALRGIDLAIAHGEAFGLVGESGCGKSVTMLAALGLLPPSAKIGGSARFDGVELLGAPAAVLDTVRGGRVAMIFQDPASALNPVHRVGAQVVEALRLHRGMDGAAARAEARRLFDLVGIPDPTRRLDAYPHEMSGGQNQRVMIAMALAGNPELLIADEPTTALDATIQAQILDLLRRVQRETGMALVLISHDLGVIADLCSKVAVMYAGRIVEQATAEALFARPAHPYTQGLLGALPDMVGPRRRLAAIEGSVPEPWAMPPGCAFAPRCGLAVAACERGVPALRLLEAGVSAPVGRSGPSGTTASSVIPAPRVAAVPSGVPASSVAPASSVIPTASDASASSGVPATSGAPTSRVTAASRVAPSPIVIPGLVPGIPTGTGVARGKDAWVAGAGGDPRDKPGDDDWDGGADGDGSDREATRNHLDPGTRGHLVACIRSDFAAAHPATAEPALTETSATTLPPAATERTATSATAAPSGTAA